MQEREVKLSLREAVPLPDPAVVLAGLGGWTAETVEQHATYYDTPDLRLTRSGVSLRFRSDDGWTVKTPSPGDGDALVHEEHIFAGPADQRPAPAEELVLGWTRSAPIEPVAWVHTVRRRWRLYDGPDLLVEVDDDLVDTEAAGAGGSFREVEVELGEHTDPRLLRKVVRTLRESGARAGTPRAKIVRALGDRALDPPDLPEPTPPGRKATIGALVQYVLAGSVRRLVAHDHLVRVGDDAEGVHQARRAATRRLRSDLHTFGPLLEPEWTDALRTELHWLGDLLGRVRDADVLLARLDERSEVLPDSDRATIASLRARLLAERALDRSELLDAMVSPRYLVLLDRLVDAARAPRFVDDGSDRPARKVARRLVRRPWKRLRRTVRALSDEPTDEQLHDVRKRAKRARYTLEATTPVAPKPVTRLAQRVNTLQDVLGEQHDAVVAGTWLRDAAAATEDATVAFVAGELANDFVAAARSRRRQWRREWRRARRQARDTF